MALRAVTDPDLIAALEGEAEYKAEPEGLVDSLMIGAGRGFVDAGEGVKQLTMQAGERLGLLGPGAAQDFSQKAQEERQFYEQTPVGQSTSGKIGRFAGNTLPYLAIPGSQAALPARIASEAAIGAGVGGAQFVPEGQSRVQNALTGGATGAGVSSGLGLLGLGVNKGRGMLSGGQIDNVVQQGQRTGVPVLAGDVSGPSVSRLSVLAEDLPLSGIRNARLNQSRLASKAAQRQLDRQAAEVAATDFGGLTGRTRLMETIQEGGPRAKSAQVLLNQIDNASDDWDVITQVSGNLKAFRTKLIADQKYDLVADLAKNKGAVKLSRTQAALDEAILNAERSALPNKGLVNTLKTLKGNLDKDLTYVEVREARSVVGSEISDYFRGRNAVIGEQGAGHLQSVKNAIQDDLDTFTSIHGAELKRASQKADRWYRENVTPFRDQQLAKALKEADPDAIYPIFINQARDAKGRGERLYKALDDKGRAAVRAGMVRQALNKAQTDDVFSPAKFAGAIDRIQKSTNTFFRGDDKTELEGFVNLMKHIKRAGQVAENPPTGQRAGNLLTLGAAGFIGSQSLTSLGGVFAATQATRLLFATEAGRKLLVRASKGKDLGEIAQLTMNLLQRGSVIGVTNGQ